MKLTFLDASVLIAAARGGTVQAARAMGILDDPERQFAASPILRLEVLPRAIYNKRGTEVAFYEAYFASVSRWAKDLDQLTEAAYRESSELGLEAVDALHVAAASEVGATELVTCEKPSRSIHRARSVRVVSIHPESRATRQSDLPKETGGADEEAAEKKKDRG